MIEDKEILMEMLHKMSLIRNFDETAALLVQRGELVGAVHCYIGEEAVAVGACAALRDDDYITGNHRSHGHPIAKGGDVQRAMAELLGKATGYCKGKGGSMHLADFSIGILGESGILASSLPVAVGAALGSKMQETDRVVIAFFGDGASNEGACHESMNLASIWKLPVIFLCENNQYAVTTHFRDTVAVKNISDRAVAYDMPGIIVDGQDAVSVYETVRDAVNRARSGEGPSLIEAKTYRYHEHSEGIRRIGALSREPYRTEEELAYWKSRDPITEHKKLLLEHTIATESEMKEVESKAKQEIEEALEFARESPYPEPDAIFEDMFANPIPIDRS